MKSSYALLRRNRVVRVWFVASLQSWVGNGAAWPALVLLAAARWHSGWAIALVLAGEFVPLTLFASLAGALADKYSRRQLMVAADVGSAAAFILIFLSSSYLLLLAGAVLAGMAEALYSPSSKAVIGQLAGKEDVPVLSAMRSFCQAFGFTLGPAIAGVVLLVASARWLLFFDAATFAVEAILLRTLPRFSPVSETAEDTAPAGLQFREGLRTARAYRVVFIILISGAIGELFAPIINVALVPFAQHLLHSGSASVGLLAAVTGVGLLSASVVMARSWSLSAMRWIYIGSWLIYGFSLPLMAYAPILGVALIAKAAQGAGNSMTISSNVALVNGTVPQRLTGRVFGLLDSTTSAAFGLSFMFAGTLLTVAGVAPALAVAGAGCILAGAVALMGMRGDIVPIEASGETAGEAQIEVPVVSML